MSPLLALLLLAPAVPARAQADPDDRRLLQLGFNRPLDGRGPLAGYAYFYYNHPNQAKTKTLRIALAPVYADGEYGLKDALGERTDLGLGLAGGGYADSYAEMRGGKYLRGESFTGDGFRASAAAYREYGDVGPAPLAGVLRGEIRHAEYRRDDQTEPGFALPNAQTDFNVRAGLRWGGVEPLMMPKLAAELSTWYEGRWRTSPGAYGYDSDRRVEPHSHLFWARALMVYNIPKAEHRFSVQAVGGTSRRADRFSAYRLGGVLPMASEFPLSIPGYYYQEISAESFGLLGGSYFIPLSRDRSTWIGSLTAATAVVDYPPGLEQGNKSHSGVGAGVAWAPSPAWIARLDYGYGINAARGHGNGAHMIGLRVQLDFLKSGAPMHVPRNVERGFNRFINALPDTTLFR